MQKAIKRSLAAMTALGLLLSLWSCSAMNSDAKLPVKAQSLESRTGAESPSADSRDEDASAADDETPAALEGNADEAPDVTTPLLPGQPETLLEPEIAIPPTGQTPNLTEAQRRILGERSGIDFDLDLFDSQEVERYFAYFTGPARETFARWLKRAETNLPYVRKALARNGLPQDLALLPFAESGYNCNAYSFAGAGGMWQFMPATARKYGLAVDWWMDERRDPWLATAAAAKYLAFLNDTFGDWYLALAAYNAGEGKISRALALTNADDFLDLVSQNDKLGRRARLKPETQDYVPKFVAITKIFQNLEALGFQPMKWNKAPKLQTVRIPGGTDLLALAKSGGMTWDAFHALNPAFRRLVSPPNRQTLVHIPATKLSPMLAYLEDPSTLPPAGFLTHKVQAGESLRALSRRYDVPSGILTQINGRGALSLKPGQTVLIPQSSVGAAVPESLRKTRRIAARRANYRVRRNETLWSISKKFNVSVKTLVEANGLPSRRAVLRPGMRISIPDGETPSKAPRRASAPKTRDQIVTRYTVRRGDTLYSLSKRFGVTADALRTWNKLKGTGIRPGDRLRVSAD